MYPWIWLWAPHVEFPLSGNVTQDIEPVANLFAASSTPEAGNPTIEQKAFQVASYGQQLGLITEILIAIAQEALPEQGKHNTSLQRLKQIQTEIEKIKNSEYNTEQNELEHRINAIRRRGGTHAEAINKKLEQF